MYAVNSMVIIDILKASDVGGSMTIHLFGAYFSMAFVACMRCFIGCLCARLCVCVFVCLCVCVCVKPLRDQCCVLVHVIFTHMVFARPLFAWMIGA